MTDTKASAEHEGARTPLRELEAQCTELITRHTKMKESYSRRLFAKEMVELIRAQEDPFIVTEAEHAAWMQRALEAERKLREGPGEAERLLRPRIVCLCGSTRFYEYLQRANYEETMAGRIVLSVGFYPHAQKEMHHSEDVGCTPEQKTALDELHKRKIDVADEVLVLNVGGYIGSSTRSEIEYAQKTGKPIRYLEVLAGAQVPATPAPTSRTFPMTCELCNEEVSSNEDTEWHGLGNCVPICDRCLGSGIEPEKDSVEQEPASPMERTMPRNPAAAPQPQERPRYQVGVDLGMVGGSKSVMQGYISWEAHQDALDAVRKETRCGKCGGAILTNAPLAKLLCGVCIEGEIDRVRKETIERGCEAIDKTDFHTLGDAMLAKLRLRALATAPTTGVK